MDLSKILAKLGVGNQLDESVKNDVASLIEEAVEFKAHEIAKEISKKAIGALSEDLEREYKTKAEEQAKEIAKGVIEPIVEEAREELINEYEEKFEEYRDGMISKFSNFVDSVLEEELSIPDYIVEYARKGELYSDLIDQFKIRIGIDESVLDEEARDLLKEARSEIQNLRGQLDETTGKLLEVQSDAHALAAHVHLRKKCDGLTESQKNRVLGLIGDVTDISTINEKFNYIKENLLVEEDIQVKKEDKVEEEIKCKCPECGKETSIKEGKCSLYNCSECETVKLVSADEKVEEKVNEKSDAPKFDKYINEYLTILKSNKI